MDNEISFNVDSITVAGPDADNGFKVRLGLGEYDRVAAAKLLALRPGQVYRVTVKQVTVIEKPTKTELEKAATAGHKPDIRKGRMIIRNTPKKMTLKAVPNERPSAPPPPPQAPEVQG